MLSKERAEQYVSMLHRAQDMEEEIINLQGDLYDMWKSVYDEAGETSRETRRLTEALTSASSVAEVACRVVGALVQCMATDGIWIAQKEMEDLKNREIIEEAVGKTELSDFELAEPLEGLQPGSSFTPSTPEEK